MDIPSSTEKLEWQAKYNPKTLELGTVSDEDFLELNDDKYMSDIAKYIKLYELHLDETLPEDFRKYMLYCGHLFYNWCVWSIKLHETGLGNYSKFCSWCNQKWAGTKCTCTNFFDGKDFNNRNGLVCFSYEGCTFFTFIVIKGPLKGTLWQNDHQTDGYKMLENKHKDGTATACTFREFLDEIYKTK